MRTRLALPLVAALVAAGTALGTAPAQAATTTAWADWSPITGTSNNYATTVQVPIVGFPRADVASDSRGPVQIAAGSSSYLGGPGDSVPTPVGAKYGSSKGHPYLTLRPKADNSTDPSTTTYTFAAPTPASGWAFVLGDIDADQVTIKALGADGSPVAASVIGTWFQGSFNYAGDADQPSWDGATSTLTGNPGAVDTAGAAGWFEPSVRLSSLTFVFLRRSGFPVYQTWFAGTARTLGGTVADVSTGAGSCPPVGATVRLLAPDGTQLAAVHPDASGAYTFGQVAAQDGYTVAVDAPTGCAVLGPAERTVDTSGADGQADFQIRQELPAPVSGTVTDAEGAPVAGVTITLTRPGGGTRTTVTDEHGDYLFDNNPKGAGYSVAVTVPDGYRASGVTTRTFDITGPDITGQDFQLAANPTVSGIVTGGGEALGAVTVTLTPATGPAITTSTQGDGTYAFERIPAGDYTIGVTPPPGYRPAPDRTVSVTTDDLTGQDFALDRPGALGGTITDTAGRPIADVPIGDRRPRRTDDGDN